MRLIVLGSNNVGKIKEINHMLESTSIRVVPQSEFDVVEAVEDGATFLDNALIKVRHAASATGLPALADDSGLEVDALGGRPGVKSARYSGLDATDEKNNAKLLAELKDVDYERRTCRFKCCMTFMRHAADAEPIVTEGALEGMVHFRKRGENGFGYDPVVWLPDYQCTVAELDMNQKNKISHRSEALRKMVAQLINLG